MVKARDQEVGQAVAFVGTRRSRNAAKTIHALGSVAGCPVHVLVTKCYVSTINNGVGAVGNDQLKGVEFIAVKSVITNSYPIDINSSWGNFIKHLAVAIARIDIAPKWRHNTVSDRRESRSGEGSHRACKGEVTVVVDVNIVVSLSIKIEGKRDRDDAG